MKHNEDQSAWEHYGGRLWARTLLLVAMICLGGQLVGLQGDVSRRGDVFGDASTGTASALYIPDADNSYDLGSSSFEFKDLYVDGTGNIDSLVAGTADIDGGTVDGASIGASTPLTYLGISPTGASPPTATSLAIQDNSASGDIVSIKSTSVGNPVLLTVEQDGTNATGGPAVEIITDDSNCDFLEMFAGASRMFRFNRSGTLDVEADLQLNSGGSVKTSNNGNITLLPNGSGIVVIGDAGATSSTLNTNDDLFVSGRLEVDGAAYFDGATTFSAPMTLASGNSFTFNSTAYLIKTGGSGSQLAYTIIAEEVTIPVSSGNTPVVVSSSNLAPANSIIKAVACRVTQAPGGGATVVSVGRTNGGNTDEFIDEIAVAIGTTGHNVANSDGTLTYTNMLQAAADTFDITTDADVTGSDMKIRIVVWYEQVTSPTS